MSDIPTINTGGIGNIKTNTNQIPNIGIGGPSIISAIDPPVVQSTPQPVIRGLELPVFQAPDTTIKYPVLNVPTQAEFDEAVRSERQKQKEEEEQKSRGLPDSKPPILPPQIQQVLPQQEKPQNTELLPPVNTNLGVPVIEVPIIGEVPIPPKEQVMLAGTTATASVAAALIGKSFVEWMVKKMKPIVQQIFIRGKKLLNRDLTSYELQLFFAAELDKKNIKLLKKEWKKEKVSQYKKTHNK
jgi:hypothetical protein